eukprot:TRINITY_DN5501_c0_g1_i3.p1 TRINITY_DN5501_c0_g1~~TRINITY_DN5501_c0_g1_i3.p1  ORF type:complete len:234 (-),score=49.40 TRINITY_DN5501_c0_g1_i3:119-742(-)
MSKATAGPVMHKLCVLGDGGVGKTALTIQLCQNHFVEEYDPTIEDSYRKQIKIDDDACLLEVLDTAGQEEFTALRDQWIGEGEGFVLVYDISNETSLHSLYVFQKQIYKVKDQDPADCKIPIAIVGNKSDLIDKRVVSSAKGKELADSMNALFFESSAKNRHNVEEPFFSLVRKIRQGQSGKKRTDNNKYSSEKGAKGKGKKGCLLI